MSFVYQIINLTNNKRYVGSTKKYDKRKERHFLDLKNGNHHCVYLQRSYNKHGVENFKMEIIYEGDNYREVEQNIINAEYDILYNTSKFSSGGDLISYHPERDIIISKMKKSINERYSFEENRMKHSKSGILNHNWKDGSTKKHETCNCGKNKVYNSLTCNDCRIRTGESNPFHGKTHTSESKKKISDSKKGQMPVNSMKIVIDDIIYDSQSAAAKAIGVSAATIHNRLKSGKFPTYKSL